MIGFTGASLQLQLIITAHILNSFWTSSVWWMSCEESLTNLGLISTPLWIHESTSFYNFCTGQIEVTTSKGSITVLYECIVSESMS
jgi:hypothetical protein